MKKSIKFRTFAGLLAWIIALGTIPPVAAGAEEIENEIEIYEEAEPAEAGLLWDEPEEPEAEVTEPEEPEAEMTEPEETEAEVSEPEETEAEVTEPEEPEAEVTEPEEPEVEVTESEAEVTEPEETEAEVTEPEEEILEEEPQPEEIPGISLYEQLLLSETLTELYELLIAEENAETLTLLTEEEITELLAKTDELYNTVLSFEPMNAELALYAEIVCILNALPNAPVVVTEEELPEEENAEEILPEETVNVQDMMTEFAAAVELFPNEADFILYDEENDAEIFDEEAYYRAYAAFYEENPDIWTTTDALFAEADDAFAAENPEGDFDAWMQENGFWEAAEKFYWVVPTPEAVAEMTAQYEDVEEVETENTVEEAPVTYAEADEVVWEKDNGDVQNTEDQKKIKFILYNYSKDINKNSKGDFRTLSKAFNFQGNYNISGTAVSSGSSPTDYYKWNGVPGDFFEYETYLYRNHPLLKQSFVETAAGIEDTTNDDRSLGYLFGAANVKEEAYAGAVTVYDDIKNTPLVYDSKTGYYEYDAASNAVDFDINENKIYVRGYTERTEPSADLSWESEPDFLADFLPFNTVTKDSDGRIKGIMGTGGENPNDSNQKRTYHYGTNLQPADMWFGASMSADFYFPKNGQIEITDETGQKDTVDMIYTFSGDDDVLVYIDGVLLMDLGGPHTRWTGTINFNTGYIEAYNDSRGKNGRDLEDPNQYQATTIYERYKAAFEAMKNDGVEPNLDVDAKLAEYFDMSPDKLRKWVDATGYEHESYPMIDYTLHTYNWFYLERHSGASNFYVKFNLPTLPQNSLMVGKELVVYNSTDDGEADPYINELSKSLSYEFAVWETDENGEILVDGAEDPKLLVQPGTKFKIQENGVVVGDGEVKEDGYFTLKAGQSALFEELLKAYQGANYIVEERIPAAFKEQYGDVLITGSEDVVVKDAEGEDLYYGYYTDVQKTDSETISMVNIFNNSIIVDKLSTFAVEKVIADGSKFDEDEEFQFAIEFGGEPLADTKFKLEDGTEVYTDDEGILTINAGQKATLTTDVISGTVYEVKEILDPEDQTTLVFYDASNGNKEYEPTSSVSRTKENLTAEHKITGDFDVDSDIVVTVTNSTYDVVKSLELTVRKIIEGNMGDRSKEFKFTAEMSDPDPENTEQAVVMFSVGSAEDIGSAENNTSEFILGHEDEHLITGIADGNKVIKITEKDFEPYDPTVELHRLVNGEETVVETIEVENGTIVLNPGEYQDGDIIVFTNTYDATIDTAVTLDYLPYIILFAIVGTGVIIAASDKRREADE